MDHVIDIYARLGLYDSYRPKEYFREQLTLAMAEKRQRNKIFFAGIENLIKTNTSVSRENTD